MEKLIERIRALRAKAEGTDNEHEAAAFASKVQELLGAHNLSEADLGIDDEGEEGVVEDVWNTLYCDPWRRKVARSAARLYMCDVYVHDWVDGKGKWRHGLTFVGKPHNLVVAREMTDYLIKTTVRLAKEYGGDDRGARLGFERGCGERLSDRLYWMWKEASKGSEVRREGGGAGNLPALYKDEAALVKDHLDKMNMRTFGRGSTMNGHSDKGWAKGGEVGLSGQIGGKSRVLLG